MWKYVLKRIIVTIPVLLGVIFIVYLIMSFTPGDPGRLILGNTATQEAVNRLNHELGADLPFFEGFSKYVKEIVLEFDFGTSYKTQRPVIDEILIRFPTTLKLAMMSIVVSACLGISLGIFSAVKQYSLADTSLTILALFFAAIPGFWFALMLIQLFCLKFGILPSNGADTWLNFVLPTITLSVGGIASMLRLTRSTMLETIRQDYIRTVRAKGAPEKIVIYRHALKNALLPVITVLGTTFSGMLGGAIIVETVFAMPGLGSYIISSIREKDMPVVLSSTLFLAALFCLIMLLVDLIHAFIDPRIKAKYSK